MKTTIEYEWDFETVNEYGDIEDHNFRDKLYEFADSDITGTLVLVRNEGNNIEGLQDRLWAYVKNGSLTECFELSSIKVPQRFHKELEKFNLTHAPHNPNPNPLIAMDRTTF